MSRMLLRGVVAALVAIGVVSSAARALFVPDLMSRAEPARLGLLGALHEAPRAHTPAELARFDGRYAAYPGVTLMHVVPGGLFLALAPLQFAGRLRRRHPAVHRWSGRALLVAAALAIVSAFHLAFVVPFGGLAETVTIAFFGGLFVASLLRAWLAIRRRDVAAHREWMIRGFAIALAISTVRIVGGALDLALMPGGDDGPRLFVISLWVGWVTTIVAAELWIQRTRAAHGLHAPAAEAARRDRLGQPVAGARRGG